MKLSDAGIEAITRREGGARLEMYRDSAGLPTIGVGHLLTKDELRSGKFLGEDWRHGIRLETALKQFHVDVAAAEAAVNDSVRVPLTPNQFDALVSFTFNVGCQAFRDSTLLERLNDDRFAAVPLQMRRWVHSGGQYDKGLENRREDEIRQWESA